MILISKCGIVENDFMSAGRIIQLGVSSIRIDIIDKNDCFDFSDVYQPRERFKFGNVTESFTS